MVATAARATTDAAARADGVRPYLWTRQRYYRMIYSGILTEDDRVELIDGEIIEMPPQNEPHAVATGLAQDALAAAFPEGFHVRVQLPVALDDRSEPEPDLAVVAGRRRDYLRGHPPTAVLVLEVADSTLAYDRRRKASLYARQGIGEYWIVNLQERVLEVYREPAADPTAEFGSSYRVRIVVPADGEMAPLATDRPVKVANLLP